MNNTGMNDTDTELYKMMAERWNAYDGLPVEMETGAKLILNPHCEYSRKRFVYRRSEVPEIRYMRDVVKKGDCVIDVGANIGYWTTVLSFQVGRTGKVLAFEPNPNTFDFLTRNITSNGCDNVVAYNVGIADTNKPGNLYVDELHSGDDRVYYSCAGKDDRARKVLAIELRTLDSYMQAMDLEKLSFIKIDVQGFETMVLKGLFNILTTSNPILLIEFSPSTYAEAGSSIEEFFEVYNKLSYKSYSVPSKKQSGDAEMILEEIDIIKVGHGFSENIILKRG